MTEKLLLEKYPLCTIPPPGDSGGNKYFFWDIVDHRGILDFYELYRTVFSFAEPKINFILKERASFLIIAIVTNGIYVEVFFHIFNAL
ncbi:hypothetical protein [Brachyspira hyodysenteriae]|uniref:hypothetical protein n=1 Tax=Brachyspira hyodysenteriae TaxID=159 RepID=UPI0022CDA6D1|nr:hypothetical protein [Brachyspira hyodysenteriae]MCZ9966174.1 hypothetical protein [Brachyspira hyodysenteriae]